MTITVDCPNCGRTYKEGDEFKHTSTGHHGDAAQTHYFECDSCDTVFDDTGATYSSKRAV